MHHPEGSSLGPGIGIPVPEMNEDIQTGAAELLPPPWQQPELIKLRTQIICIFNIFNLKHLYIHLS